MNILPKETKYALQRFIETNNSYYLISITDNNKVISLIEVFWNKALPIWHKFVEENAQQKTYLDKILSVEVGYDDFKDKSKTFFHRLSKPIKIEMKFVKDGEENNDLGKHYIVSLDIIDDLLYLSNQSFYVRPIETSLDDFKQNFIYTVYYAAEYIWHVYENAHTLGIDDLGVVISNELAKRILKIHLKSDPDRKSYIKQLERLESGEDIHINEYNGGWAFAKDNQNIGDFPIIQTLEGNLKETYNHDSEYVPYEYIDDDDIADLIWQRQLITCIVNKKPLTFILHEVD